jgi:hypothetical protein
MVLKFENYSHLNVVKSKDSLREHLQGINSDEYQTLETRIFLWCSRIIEGEIEDVYNEVAGFIVDRFPAVFGIAIKYSMDYLEDKQFEAKDRGDKEENVFKDPVTGLQFDVCTIHSVKGETHFATLYMETFYENRNGVSYESQRLKDQLLGIPFNDPRKYHRQSAKMVYVGFSRAKYLLCFAANVNHFTNEEIRQLRSNGWEVREELTT